MSEPAKPTEIFLGYMAPLAIGEARDQIDARWRGLLAFVGEASFSDVDALVQTLFGKTAAAATTMPAAFVASLNKADELFVPKGRERELQLLSAAALDHIFSHDSALDKAASTGIGCASFGGRAPNEIPLDIVGRAFAEIDAIALTRRDRTWIGKKIEALASVPKIDAAAAIATYREGKEPEQAALAMEAIVANANAALANSAKLSKAAMDAVMADMSLLEEESDVHWWSYNRRSRDLGETFDDLQPHTITFVAAREIADKTSIPLDRRTLNALLSHCGVAAEPVSLLAAINGVNPKWITERADGDHSALTMPLHRALHRRVDVAVDGAWVAGWTSATGIPADLSIPGTHLGWAFYLECMLNKSDAA